MQRQGFIGGSAASRIRATGGVLLAAHLAFVAWYTLRPLDVPWVMPANLRPLDGIRADFALGWATGLRRTGESMALLAPLGVLLPMAGGRLAVSRLGSLVRTMAAAALVSLAVELLQTAVPGQVVDVDSLLLNTAGAALAHAAVVPAGRAWLRRRTLLPAADGAVRRDEVLQGRTPTIARVGIAPWSDALPPSSP
ncbi:VanZ family protein [Streptomyces althioticus]|uniref:VanZ family protein n=1 Tax=Streptomyces althioticus TaxID=83380 RepID=UPI00369D0916